MMKTKIFLILVLFVFARAAVSAQEETWSYTPKNTITFDIGAAALSLISIRDANMSSSEDSYHISSAIQYERQLPSEKWSLAGRLEYTGFFLPKNDTQLSFLFAEAHCRYYPYADYVFLDGMLGYGNSSKKEADWVAPMSHYLLVGGKFGWKVDFASPGGFVLDFSWGFRSFFGKRNISDEAPGSTDIDGGLGRLMDAIFYSLHMSMCIDIHIGYRF